MVRRKIPEDPVEKLPRNITLHLPGESIIVFRRMATLDERRLVRLEVGDDLDRLPRLQNGEPFLLLKKNDFFDPSKHTAIKSAIRKFISGQVAHNQKELDIDKKIQDAVELENRSLGATGRQARRDISYWQKIKQELKDTVSKSSAIADGLIDRVHGKYEPLPGDISQHLRREAERATREVISRLPDHLQVCIEALAPTVAIVDFPNPNTLGMIWPRSPNTILLAVQALADMSTWQEEVLHGLDNTIERPLCSEPAWKKAVEERYVTRISSKKSETLEHELAFEVSLGKSNTPDRLAAELKPEMNEEIRARVLRATYNETLPYIAAVERNMSDPDAARHFIEEQKLDPNITVDGIMRQAFGSLWLMYHGAAEGKKLDYNVKTADLEEVDRDAAVRDGWEEFVPFNQRCIDFVKDKTGKTITIDPLPQPAPEGADREIPPPRPRRR